MTVVGAEKYVQDDGYDKLALGYGKKVIDGNCDPIAAEATLSDYSSHDTEEFMTTSKGVRGAEA